MVGTNLPMRKQRAASQSKPFRQLYIQEWRERIDPPMTQEDLAEIMGVDAMSVSRWENHKRFPRGRRLPQLAQALKCTVNDLYHEPTDLVSIDSMLSGASKGLRKQAEAIIRALKDAEEAKK